MMTDEQAQRESWRRMDIEDAHRDIQRAYLARHGKPYITPNGNEIPTYHSDYSDDNVERIIKRHAPV